MASISFHFSPDYDPILILIGASSVAGGTATQFSYISQLTGATVTVYGTGLTYDAAGKPLTGTITSMYPPSDMTTSTVEISGMAMPVATLVSTLLGFFAGTPSTPSQADRFLSILRAGNDQIVAGGTGAVVLSGGTGDDRIAVVEADSTLYGGLGNDTLDGSIGNDLLDGGLGADRLNGAMGWDIATWATAGSGVRADLLFDTVNPGFRGQVTTGTGIDTVIECEELELTAFADVVQIANEGHDEGLAIWAGAGNDTLNALGTGGTLYGGDGIDLITGESTADGGRGVDVIVARAVSFASADIGGHGVRLTLGNTAQRVLDDGFGFSENARATSFYALSSWGDSVAGGLTGDHVLGAGGNDTMNGFAGHDTLLGEAGNDLITGDLGNDVLGGGEGRDTLFGGDGIDELALWDAGSFFGGRVDLFLNQVQDDGFGTQDTISGFEGVSGTDLGDTLLGNVLGNKLSGLLGNDRLDGRGGNDQLVGGEGNDTLIGGAGNDTIMGGMGRDWMDGGEGIDLLVFSTDPAENSYAVNVNLAGANWMVNGDGYGEQEWARGFEQASGTSLNDTLHGSSLGDTLWGNAGNDNLRGWFGDDVLWGGEGNDLIIGGEGRDTLRGGLGIDTVQGGGGVDIFVFSGDARDIVQDFASGFDRLWIWKAAPDLVLNGPLGAAQFASGAGLRAATTAAQRVIYDTTTGDLLMDADGQGGAAAVAFANLATIPAVSAADFWIV